MNAASAANATMKSAMMRIEDQPTLGPSMTAYANEPTASANSSWPATSNRRSRGSRDSATKRSVTNTATMPTGALTRKMLRQPLVCTRRPPSVGPIAIAVLAIAVQMPIARAFCFGSGNAALTSASDVTFTVAAAIPCTVRATFSTSSVGAMPQPIDDAVNTAMPAM